jgi:hypothetical protein
MLEDQTGLKVKTTEGAKGRTSFRSVWITLLLLAVTTLSAQPVLSTLVPKPVRYHDAMVGVVLSGVFHEAHDHLESVFWLENASGPVRLIFYCNQKSMSATKTDDAIAVTYITELKVGIVSTGTAWVGLNGQWMTHHQSQNMIVEQWDFCTEPSQIPIRDGELVRLKGTLIQPSDWNPELSERHMDFHADLYVMEILA